MTLTIEKSSSQQKPKHCKSTYMQLKELSLPHIEAFHDDLLKHDRQMITHRPKTPFLHYTRACGTHMFQMLWTSDLPAKGERVPYLFSEADRRHIAYQTVECARAMARQCYRNDQKLVLHFDGTRFHEIDVDKAVKIAKEYYDSLVSEWINNPSL